MNEKNPNEIYFNQIQEFDKMKQRVRERMTISKMRIIGNLRFPYDPSLDADIGTVKILEQEGSPMNESPKGDS